MGCLTCTGRRIVDTVKNNPDTKQGWFYFNNDTIAISNAKEMIALANA
jgi:hypothetical protein